MTTVIAFELPGLPRMTNNNSRKHWSSQYREAKKWKMSVKTAIVFHRLQPAAPFKKAKLTLIRCSSNCPDSDGLVSSFKHVVDGLVEAGVLVNDKFENIGMPDYQWEKCSPNKGKIRIVVAEAI